MEAAAAAVASPSSTGAAEVRKHSVNKDYFAIARASNAGMSLLVENAYRRSVATDVNSVTTASPQSIAKTLSERSDRSGLCEGSFGLDSAPGSKAVSRVSDSKQVLPVFHVTDLSVSSSPNSGIMCTTTLVTATETEPPKTQVVKSVYTTKSGTSTRIFTVETTTDSVTRRNSMLVAAGVIPPPPVTNEIPNVTYELNSAGSSGIKVSSGFSQSTNTSANTINNQTVPYESVRKTQSTTVTKRKSSFPNASGNRSLNNNIVKQTSHESPASIQLPSAITPSRGIHNTSEDGASPIVETSQVKKSRELNQPEDISVRSPVSRWEVRKSRPWKKTLPRLDMTAATGEREKGLAGMEFCAFLFRKGRVRPRVRHRQETLPVFHITPPPQPNVCSPAKLPGNSVEEVCVAEVSPVSDASSSEVIDNRSKTVEQILEILKKGTQLWKIRSFTKWYRRSYYLDDKEGTVKYEPSHKAPCIHTPLKIAIDDIVDVRKGWKTDTFNKIEKKVERRRIKFPSQPSPVDERCCFSIIYSNNKQSLDLCALEPKIADMWVRGLRHIVTVLKGLHQEERFERWLEQKFYEADVDKNNGLNFEESLKLLKQLNVKMPRNSVKKIFDEANTIKHSRNGEQVLDADEFVGFYMNLMSRSEIKEIYLRYCKNNKEMTVSDLMDFIHKEQKGHDTTKEECLSLIEAFEQSNVKTDGRLSLIGFTNMLMSEQFDVLKQHHKVVYQDMHQPLSHYFIATSHNTYLTGNQLHGESSVEGYIDALKQGCRCVELDCWDGPEGDPIIYHGYTLTSKILFRDVLVDAIKPYAFHSSEYPVILSLENHLSPKQQEVLTKHLIEVLGDMLYSTPVNESWEFLPSPEDLKLKVIIKAKKRASIRNADGGEDSNSEDEAIPPPGIQQMKIDPNKGKAEVAPVLSSLVNVCEAVHFHSFEDSEANQKCYQMSSFSEAKANKFIEIKGIDFVKYNTKHLSRIYPAGTRTDSSNFKPTPYWNVGCQLVALNYQHAGKPMLYNDAKFQDNGGCGYVLKPDFLRKKGYDPESTLNDRKQVTLKLTVISGQHIPKADQDVEGEIVDPYVKVKIIGHSKDNQKFKTEAVRNNGFNPIWNNEMTFNIMMPELAVIHFIVKDLSNTGKDVTLGTYAIPFLSMQEGYSHVYLKDYNRNFVSPASLFIHMCIV